MKKLLSVFLSAVMIITAVLVPSVTFAQENRLENELTSKMTSEAEFLLKDIAQLDLYSANDFVTYYDSGYDMSDYIDGFLLSIKTALDESNGRLLYYGAEDLGFYASVIAALEKIGENPSDFHGYNLVECFENLAPNQISNPYNYRLAIEIASPDFAHKLCDQLIEDYYTMGKGMNFWGYSCDNTAMLITSVSVYKDDYAAVIDDAVKLIDTYTKDEGCFYSEAYNDVSPDSTASALMAYAALGNADMASVMYRNLMAGFEGENGIISYYGEVNAYSTKGTLLALEYFMPLVKTGYGHILKLNSVITSCTAPQKRLYTCEDCDYKFTATSYKTMGHNKTTTVKKATTKADGSVVTKCLRCGKIFSEKRIARIASVSVTSSQYTYTGKRIEAGIRVKNSDGKTISKSNYTVKYTGNTKVGTGKAVITFKGNYSGKVTRSLKIIPTGTTLTSLKAKSKGFTAKWKKQSTQTSGYQIKYSTSSSFKNSKTITVSGTKTVTKTVSKLKAKKKYYVRVRTYKVVDGKKYYSYWSSPLSVKTEK